MTGSILTFLLTETERAQWILSVQPGEAWLADFSSGVRRGVSCLDDGRQHPAGHPCLHPDLHGVPDHSVQHFPLVFIFVLCSDLKSLKLIISPPSVRQADCQ